MVGLMGPDVLGITFDLDWAPDEVIEDTLDLCARYGVAVTLFATHATTVLEGVTAQMDFAVHPSFNGMLRDGVDLAQRIRHLQAFSPDAAGIRSHSLFGSTVLSELFCQLGFRSESNTLSTGSVMA